MRCQYRRQGRTAGKLVRYGRMLSSVSPGKAIPVALMILQWWLGRAADDMKCGTSQLTHERKASPYRTALHYRRKSLNRPSS